MKRLILRAAMVAWFTLWGAASGAAAPPDVRPVTVCKTECCPRDLLWGCPDDYCHKPGPRTWRVPCGQCDDYCRKPCPKVSPLGCCNLPDDYCRKPCPHLCRPLCPDHYSCGSAGSCHPVLPDVAPPIQMRQQGAPAAQNLRPVWMESPYHSR